MVVLAVTALPLVAGVLLSGGYIAGEQDVLIHLAILAVLHGTAGWVSWSCRATGWGDGLMWAVALTLHTVTYALNWEIYVGLEGRDGAIKDLAILTVIVIPSLLMYAGPFRAIIRPPEELYDDLEG